MLRRMTHPVVVCEWDEEERLGTLVVGCPQVEASWAMITSVWESLDRMGVGWGDEEMRERWLRGRCVGWDEAKVAVLWRLSFESGGGARVFASVVAAGLGVEIGHEQRGVAGSDPADDRAGRSARDRHLGGGDDEPGGPPPAPGDCGG